MAKKKFVTKYPSIDAVMFDGTNVDEIQELIGDRYTIEPHHIIRVSDEVSIPQQIYIYKSRRLVLICGIGKYVCTDGDSIFGVYELTLNTMYEEADDVQGANRYCANAAFSKTRNLRWYF